MYVLAQAERLAKELCCWAETHAVHRQTHSHRWHFMYVLAQADCLAKEDVLLGRNLVYAAPTSGGKSLVAEILMLRRLCATRKPAMLVLPLRALCDEKARHLDKLLDGSEW